MTKEQLDELRGHTPGPWKLLEGFGDCGVYAGKLELLHYTYKHDGRNKANAQLIAAAPDLLAHIDEQQRQIECMRDALSKFVHLAYNIEAYGAMANEDDWQKVAFVRGIAREALKEVGDD